MSKDITDRKYHGMSGTPVYNSWANMKQRCTNPRHPKYPSYGGRGVHLCPEWYNFYNFYEDMGDRPEGMTIDRIDNNRGYNKENCKWATAHQQSRNTQRTLSITIEGVTQCLEDWANTCSANRNTIYRRFYERGESGIELLRPTNYKGSA